MQKHEREALDAAQSILKPLGWKVELVHKRRGGHMVLTARLQDRVEKYTISCSPAMSKSQLDRARQWANRLIRS